MNDALLGCGEVAALDPGVETPVTAEHVVDDEENQVRYMKNVIKYETPNAETIEAIEEVRNLKENPNKKTYSSFAGLMKDIDNE